MNLTLGLLAATLPLAASTKLQSAEQAARPNIVYILAEGK